MGRPWVARSGDQPVSRSSTQEMQKLFNAPDLFFICFFFAYYSSFFDFLIFDVFDHFFDFFFLKCFLLFVFFRFFMSLIFFTKRFWVVFGRLLNLGNLFFKKKFEVLQIRCCFFFFKKNLLCSSFFIFFDVFDHFSFFFFLQILLFSLFFSFFHDCDFSPKGSAGFTHVKIFEYF